MPEKKSSKRKQAKKLGDKQMSNLWQRLMSMPFWPDDGWADVARCKDRPTR